MVYDAETTARNAERSTHNGVGLCLQWARERAGIGPLHRTAAIAWQHATHRHKGDKNPPRGAMVYWTGGSKGYGHIAVSLGGGKIRSSDAGGPGKPGTVALGWVEDSWRLPYAGWADNVNDQIIPGVGDDPMTENDWKRLRAIVADEVHAGWNTRISVSKPDGTGKTKKSMKQILREILQRVQK